MVKGEKFAVDPEQINVKFEDVKGVRIIVFVRNAWSENTFENH